LNQSVNGSLALPSQNTALSAKDRVLFALGRKPIPLKAQQPSIQEKVQPESSAWDSLSQIFGSPVDSTPTLPTPPELSLNTRVQNQSKLGENQTKMQGQTEILTLNTSSQLPKQITIATKGLPVQDAILNDGDQKLYRIWNNNISKAQENVKSMDKPETATQILPLQNTSSSLPSSVATISCEFCKKAYEASTILMHISKSPACKSYYGPRFVEMMKNKYGGKSPASQVQNVNAKTVDRVLDSADKSQPQKSSFLSWAFDAKSPPPNPQTGQIKKVDPSISLASVPAVQKAASTPVIPENIIPMANDENVDRNTKKQSVNPARDSTSKLAVLYNSMATISCEFCKTVFGESTLLMHVGKNPACKSYYGPRFIEMKKKKSPKAYVGKNSVLNVQVLEKLAIQNSSIISTASPQNVIPKAANQSENGPMQKSLDGTQNVNVEVAHLSNAKITLTAQTLERKTLASQIQDVANKKEIIPTKTREIVSPPQNSQSTSLTTQILVRKSPVSQVQSAKILNLLDTQPQTSMATATKKPILQLPKKSSTADLLDPKSGFQISVLAPQTIVSASPATGALVSHIQNAGQSVNSNSEKTVPNTQTNISKSPKSVKVTTANQLDDTPSNSPSPSSIPISKGQKDDVKMTNPSEIEDPEEILGDISEDEEDMILGF
jgi:hypothetical protein